MPITVVGNPSSVARRLSSVLCSPAPSIRMPIPSNSGQLAVIDFRGMACFVPSGARHRPNKDYCASKTESCATCMKPAPANQQGSCLGTGKITAWRQQLVIGRHDDNKREWHDGPHQQSRDQPADTTTLKPSRHAADKAEDRKRCLQPGGALVAGRPLQHSHLLLKTHACRMFQNIIIESCPGEQSGGKCSEKLSSENHCGHLALVPVYNHGFITQL